MLKNFIFWLLDFIQLPRLWLFLNRNRAVIFLYHGVSPEIKNYGIFNYRKKNTTPEAFRHQLRWLKEHFTILPLPYLIELLEAQKSFPKRAAAITFDDGYQNIYQYAFPILRELNLPATLFITTDLTDKKEPLWVDQLEYAIGHTESPTLTLKINGAFKTLKTSSRKERCATDSFLRDLLKKLPYAEVQKLLAEIITQTGRDLKKDFINSPYRGATWEELKDMQQAGIIIAPHTLSHPILSRLSSPKAEREINESQKRIQTELQKTVPIFAYPNGQAEDFNEETVSLLKKAGFTAALTTIPATADVNQNLFSLPRFSLDGSGAVNYFFRTTVSGLRKSAQDVRYLINPQHLFK